MESARSFCLRKQRTGSSRMSTRCVRTFLQKYPDVYERFVSGLIEAEEKLRGYAGAGGAEMKASLATSAGILLDDSTAVSDMEGMYIDARFVGIGGNSNFFGNPNNPRRFEALNTEVQRAFVALGLRRVRSRSARRPLTTMR